MKNGPDFSIEQYKACIDELGLKKTWQEILKTASETDSVSETIQARNFSELYEFGLAYTDKNSKKSLGKYYTPNDVSELLSDFFDELPGKNICDVCCGTGNLILAYLKRIGKEKAISLISSGFVYLYDIDEIAMDICKYSIGLEYGDCIEHIHFIHGDFLSKKTELPPDCKVISNPPFFKISEFNDDWIISDIIRDSREYYSAFMEKIIQNSKASVIITPFGFLGGDKFYSLRKMLNEYNGKIFSFDNVPANIFNGKKYGIFNTNNANSVRAAITVVENKPNVSGFQVSPLIRFQSDERDELLHKSRLTSLLPDKYLTVSELHPKYPKCFKQLQPIYDEWMKQSNGTFQDLLSIKPTDYKLDVPTTCRYFMAAAKNLNRNGKNTFYFRDELSYLYAYCLLNSSFAYWYWRLFDGGFTYPISLLKSIPIKINSLSDKEKQELKELVYEIQSHESEFLVYKKNASKIQENMKLPSEYRDKLNCFLLSTLNIQKPGNLFDCVHSNRIQETSMTPLMKGV